MATRLTQVTVEFGRGRYSDVTSPQVYVSQLNLELLVPYVDLTTFHQKTGSNGVTFGQSASATFASGGTPKSGTNSVTFAAIASASARHIYAKSASNHVTFFVANYLHTPEVVIEGQYHGRYQLGREVNLFIRTRTGVGVPTVPDSEPTARIYGPNGYVETVTLPAVRNADTTGVFGLAHKLGDIYEVGRYHVLYMWPNQAVHYNETEVFELNEGGDSVGVVISGAVCYRPDDMYVLVQTDTGRLLAGRNPVLATIPDPTTVLNPPATSPEVILDSSYLGRVQVGRSVMLTVWTRDGYGVPHNPTSEPVARIYAASGVLVDTFSMASVRGQTGLFQLRVLLDDSYDTGRYDVLYHWTISSTVYSEWSTFEVDDGGDPWGHAISLYHHVNPEDAYVLAQLMGGQIVAGRRPQFP